MSENVDPKMDLAEKLAVEEYKACRDLISKNIDIIEKSEVYAVGAAAAAAVFSLSSTTPLVKHASSYLPLIIAVIGFIRFVGIDSTLSIINDYLKDLEERYPEYINWTSSYRKNRTSLLKFSRYSIWGILVALGVVFVHVAYL